MLREQEIHSIKESQKMGKVERTILNIKIFCHLNNSLKYWNPNIYLPCFAQTFLRFHLSDWLHPSDPDCTGGGRKEAHTPLSFLKSLCSEGNETSPFSCCFCHSSLCSWRGPNLWHLRYGWDIHLPETQLHPLPLVLQLLPLTQTQSICPSAPQTTHTCVQLGPPGEGFVLRSVSLWEDIICFAGSNELPHPQPPCCWFLGWNLSLTHCHWTCQGPQRLCW